MWDTDVNYLAVISAGVITMAIGFLWYGELLFGNMWMKAIGKSKSEIEESAKAKGPLMYLWPFLSALVMYWTLAVVMKSLGADTLLEGVISGLIVWAGIVVMSQIPAAVFNETKRDILVIYIGYLLACFLINGSLIGWWQ